MVWYGFYQNSYLYKLNPEHLNWTVLVALFNLDILLLSLVLLPCISSEIMIYNKVYFFLPRTLSEYCNILTFILFSISCCSTILFSTLYVALCLAILPQRFCCTSSFRIRQGVLTLITNHVQHKFNLIYQQ